MVFVSLFYKILVIRVFASLKSRLTSLNHERQAIIENIDKYIDTAKKQKKNTHSKTVLQYHDGYTTNDLTCLKMYPMSK